MKKLLSLIAALLVLYGLSQVGETLASIALLSFLCCFVVYLFVTSKSRKLNLITIIYVLLSFVFVVFTTCAILSVDYNSHPFVSMLILCILLPTFFLLGYRIILSIHCFIDSLLGKNKKFEETDEELGCSVVITTRNEPFDVCKLTFDSAYQLDYPTDKIEIIIVDNSDLDHSDFLKWQGYVNNHNMQDGISCKFIHRNGTEGFKPRNLDIAMQHINFDYVLFLDADSTLPQSALKVGLPEFKKDSKLGFVSFLIESTNYSTNLVTKVASIFQNTIRYFNEFVGKYGYCNYQGHNGIWSKQALQATSKWEEYYKSQVMVTEDIAAGFRCYEAGFNSKPIFLKTGEWVPTSLKEFEKMWLRWSFGGMQVMHKYMSNIISSSNLNFRVKLDMLYLLFKVVASGFPIFALLLVIFPRNNIAFVSIVNVTLIPLLILSVWYYLYGDIKGSFISKISQIYIAMFMLSSFVFWCGIKAEINYYLNKPQGWKPTSKVFDKVEGWAQVIYDNIGKLSFSLVGLIIAIYSIFTLYSQTDFYLYMLCMLPSILLFLNTILCVLVLGRARY
ncbi:glycosyltransferase family 2 protein [Francisella philomiragia]|uniref:Glycosyl transferase 2 family protein n=1 Tax=Francisella philomiragia TaxID=28110 RepID=A0AAW3D8Q0_9GAMM|nr:glycosyltransferase [Francisella philomiragia]KFJ42164.1 glycosyl transferase 2 family protein [Francisella philomiragia]MBK2254915.1 glycosyltransferase family 2 protein [Francisella philomiragia]MBK2273228.1 glycosyltransferase family 2 protein [Francisella philomiragia]MBK2276999.1 glycosyltransferase family 2 protein [Francisella philomiragia]MBK2280989.1 glycosyltransferase family 2 protein [Francisella philomiragia]